jgi:hypothetical protein
MSQKYQGIIFIWNNILGCISIYMNMKMLILTKIGSSTYLE